MMEQFADVIIDSKEPDSDHNRTPEGVRTECFGKHDHLRSMHQL